MTISKDHIDGVKRCNDIVSVIRSKGIKLKKKGRNYVGLCPFHKEKTPSFIVDPVKQLYNCFGCTDNGKGSTGGDVIGFVVRYDKIPFPQAIEQLSTQKTVVRVQGAVKIKKQLAIDSCQLTDKEKKKTNHQPETVNRKPITPKNQKLLNRVVEFYHKTLTQDDKGLRYLTDIRKITGKSIFADFKIGYSNGTLLKALPGDGDIIESLKEIGILNKKGNELFYGSVTFPGAQYNIVSWASNLPISVVMSFLPRVF